MNAEWSEETLRAVLRTWLDTPSGSAENEDVEDALIDAAKAWLDESDEPAILGCGCIVGTHDNSSAAMHEAHPEILGWDAAGDPHLRIGVGTIDPERLARALIVVNRNGDIAAAREIIAVYSSLSAVPGTETDLDEREKIDSQGLAANRIDSSTPIVRARPSGGRRFDSRRA